MPEDKVTITVEMARNAIESAEKNEPTKVWDLAKSILLDLVERVCLVEQKADRTYRGAAGLSKQMKEVQPILEALKQAAGGAVPPAEEGAQPTAPAVSGGERLGADGSPITDPTQLAAEEAMDAATGVAPAAPPTPAQLVPMPRGGRRRAAPPRSAAPRVGADGSEITDPAQLAAEEAMDAATEGR